METPSHLPDGAVSGGTAPVPPPAPVIVRQGPSWGRILLVTLGILVLGCVATAATTAWWVKRNFYAEPIQPVHLTQSEQTMLEAKLHVLETSAAPATGSPNAPTLPEASPGEQERTLLITAKEINAYLATQNLGENVRVDLGNDSISATVIAPVPADSGLPLVSGTTLRLSLALAARMDANKKLAVEVRDVRIGGVPIPNAWLGDIKGMNLAGEDLEKDPALQQFFKGIQDMKITPAGLRVVLAE